MASRYQRSWKPDRDPAWSPGWWGPWVFLVALVIGVVVLAYTMMRAADPDWRVGEAWQTTPVPCRLVPLAPDCDK